MAVLAKPEVAAEIPVCHEIHDQQTGEVLGRLSSDVGHLDPALRVALQQHGFRLVAARRTKLWLDAGSELSLLTA